MPSVRNLISDKNGSPVATAEAPPKQHQAPPPAAVSVEAEVVNETPVAPKLNGALALADAFDAAFGGLATLPENSGASALDELGGQGSGPFVACLNSRSKRFNELKAIGVNEADFYLSADGQIIRCNPLNYWLVAATAFRTKMASDGSFVAATTDLSDDKLDSHVLALILVDLGDRIVPAKADFRVALDGAVIPAIRANALAATPDWVKSGEAYAVSAAFPVPFGRVYTSATARMKVSKSTGNPYPAGVATARPATVDQMRRLQAALTNPDFLALVGEAKKGYNDRFEQIMAKVRK